MTKIAHTIRKRVQQPAAWEAGSAPRALPCDGRKRLSAQQVTGMLLGAGLLLMVLASVARAGEWAQDTCAQPNGRPAPVEDWHSQAIGSYGTGSGPSDTCAQGGALTATDSSAGIESAYNGPMWVYDTPAGSTIAGGSITVTLTSPQGQAYIATPENSYDQADVLINCQYNMPCGSNGTETATVPISHPGGTQLFAAAVCVGPYQGATTCPATPGGGPNAQITVHAAEIELSNSSTPTASGFSGALLTPGASATADLAFNAQDPGGPGVYRITATIDNTTVYQGTPDTNSGKCASIATDTNGVNEFLYAQPCKQNISVDLPIDTTRFPNGQHQLKITVQDAATNTAVVHDSTISINNPTAKTSLTEITGPTTPPGPPAPQIISRGAPNGINATDQATLTAHWTTTRKAHLTSSYGHPQTIEGQLTGPGDQAIQGALIDLTATPAYAGAKPIVMPSPRTGPNGRFQIHLPGGISSRTLTLAYRSHLADTQPAATRTLTLNVHAQITLNIAPNTASVGEQIFFKGQLHGQPIPPAGKQLVLEARSPGTPWVEFHVIRTDTHGHFHSSYRFHLPGPHTYKFRVLSKYEADFPFIAGTSNTVDVQEH